MIFALDSFYLWGRNRNRFIWTILDAEEQALFGIGLLVLSIGVGILAYGIYSKNKKGDDLS